MSRIFETDKDIANLVEERFSATGLDTIGLNLRVMSVTKQRDVVKANKATDATEFLIDTHGTVQVFVYEGVFSTLDEETQKFLIDMALSNISYNSEKDKIVVESNPYVSLFGMRKKFGDRADELLEASYLAIKQFEDKNS